MLNPKTNRKIRMASAEKFQDVLNGRVREDIERYRKGYGKLRFTDQSGRPIVGKKVTVPTFGDTPEDEELQADLLELLYTLWFSHPAMRDIVYWNLPDGYAFRDPKNPTWNENQCYGGLFHHDMTPKRAALRLQKLTHEIWHTEVEAETDRSGEVDFRGFYGTYTAKIGEQTVEFSLHSGENPVHFIAL